MERLIYSYEYAAAKVYDVPIEGLFIKTRKDGTPFVRQILMYYRIVELNKTQAEAAIRYGLDRTTAFYAKKKINRLMKFPKRKAQYDEFIKLSDRNFLDPVQKKSTAICDYLNEIVELSYSSQQDFEAHEKRMSRLAECEKELKEMKKLIMSRWKKQ